MADSTKNVVLPIEVSDLGSPVMGSIMAVVWGALAALLAFACIADGLDKGFGSSWWIGALSVPFWWLCYGALTSALGREFHTVSAGEVRARIRVLRSWREWSEPIGTYRGVEISSAHYNAGQGSASGSYTATLIHSRDSSRNVTLKGWSWSRNGEESRSEQEALAEAYARETMELLGLSDK
jgi:hypothetical protein